MTPTRRLLLAAAALLPLALAACDNKCPTQNPKLASGGVPACAGIQAGAPVTVRIGVCPRCDETYDSCTVTLPDPPTCTTPGCDPVNIQLDPLVQVCSANPTCPLPGSSGSSCNPVTCTFQAPAAGSYQLLVFDPEANAVVQQPFTTVTADGATSCGV
jgi:hypothetical protein